MTTLLDLLLADPPFELTDGTLDAFFSKLLVNTHGFKLANLGGDEAKLSIASVVTFDPVLSTSGSAPVLGTGSATNGAYLQLGPVVIAWSRIVFGSGHSDGTGTYTITFPNTVPAASSPGTALLGFSLIDKGDESAITIAMNFSTGGPTQTAFEMVFPSTWPSGSLSAFAGGSPFGFLSGGDFKSLNIYTTNNGITP